MTTIRNTQDLGAFIRRMRKARGYTQAQLAELAGVGVVYVSNLENGKETAEVGKALHLLQLLSVDLVATDRRAPLNGGSLDNALFDDEQEVPSNSDTSHKNEYLVIPALLGEDGEAHLMGPDQAFWHRIGDRVTQERPSEDA